MARKTIRREPRLVGAPLRRLVAASMCLAVGLLLVGAQASLAISGFATDGPAVHAQYPDSRDLGKDQPGQPPVSTLADLVRMTRPPQRDPDAAARERADFRAIAREARQAVAKPVSLGARESGSALLLAGFAVAGLASGLRWRRGRAQPLAG